MPVIWKYAAAAAAIGAFVFTWCAHRAGYSAGYDRGHNEAVEAANQRLIEDNDMLASANALLAGRNQALTESLNERTKTLDDQQAALESSSRRLDAATAKHTGWSCTAVPQLVADSLRTPADSHARHYTPAACPAR